MKAVFFPDGKQMLTARVRQHDSEVGTVRPAGKCPSKSHVGRLEGVGRDGVMALSRQARWLLTASDGKHGAGLESQHRRTTAGLGGASGPRDRSGLSPDENLAFSGDARAVAGCGAGQRRRGAGSKSASWWGTGRDSASRRRPSRPMETPAHRQRRSHRRPVGCGHGPGAEKPGPRHRMRSPRCGCRPTAAGFLTGCSDRSLRLLGRGTRPGARPGKRRANRPANEKIDAVDFAPDGKMALVRGRPPRRVHCTAGQRSHARRRPGAGGTEPSFGALSSARFSPDGTALLTVGANAPGCGPGGGTVARHDVQPSRRRLVRQLLAGRAAPGDR